MLGMASPRQPPAWVLWLSAKYPAVPTIVTLGGLVAILCVLAPANIAAEASGRGSVVETVAIVGPESAAGVVLQLRTVYRELVPAEVRQWAGELYANPMLYLVVPFLLLLEYLFPLQRSRPLLVRAYLQDITWFVASAPTRVLIVGVVAAWLNGFYDSHLDFLTIESATDWPLPIQLAAGVLLGEFLFWFHHMARHKIRALWLFHAVHHSQKELTIFTEDRVHVVDLLVQPIVAFIPLFMFQVPELWAVAVFGLYRTIHARLLHANVKMNLGIAGYVLASPQFHRVHHSRDPQHQDTNFGGILSLFDYLFGTAHRSRDVYPATGIDDVRFPTEDRVPVWQLPWNWVRQTAYPFGQLFGLLATIPTRLQSVSR